jgi:hypothetical protein
LNSKLKFKKVNKFHVENGRENEKK